MNSKRVSVPAMIAGLLALGTALPGVASARDHHRVVPQASAQPRYHHGYHRHHPSDWRHEPRYRRWAHRWDHRWHHRWHRRDFDRRYNRHYHRPHYWSYYDRDDGRAHIIIRYHYGAD